MLSIIIPTYNRLENLRLIFTALELQTFRNFEVIVVDDGSTDGTNMLTKSYKKIFDLKYVYQKDEGYRLAKVRNLGASVAKGSGFIFLDSDILLTRKSLEAYNDLHKKYPDKIICGLIHWLNPMVIRKYDVINNFDKIINNKLRRAKHKDRGPKGQDMRLYRNIVFSNTKFQTCAGAMFAGNVLIPKKIFELEKFDENFKSHGGEDGELGIRINKRGYKCIFTPSVIGYHISHPRNQKANAESAKENINYIKEKYRMKK